MVNLVTNATTDNEDILCWQPINMVYISDAPVTRNCVHLQGTVTTQ
jgi:hypothetical protein